MGKRLTHRGLTGLALATLLLAVACDPPSPADDDDPDTPTATADTTPDGSPTSTGSGEDPGGNGDGPPEPVFLVLNSDTEDDVTERVIVEDASVTLILRTDLQTPEGEPFTSFTIIERLNQELGFGPEAGEPPVRNLGSVDAVDDYTLRFHFERPIFGQVPADLVDFLATFEVQVIAAASAGSADPTR